jgi:hypothetical protein
MEVVPLRDVVAESIPGGTRGKCFNVGFNESACFGGRNLSGGLVKLPE